MTQVTVHADAAETRVVVPATNTDIVISDALGRRLTIREPDVLQESRLVRALGDAAMNTAWMMSFAMPAAMVTQIDAETVPFPMSERQIEAAVQRLGRPGLMAVMRHIQSLAEASEQEAAIKKSAGTLDSDPPAG
ncbi:MAG: hypothetical protein ACRES6_08965 [Steroidobacteraceae bacterium]